jgi:hypothetical protein
VRYLIETLKNNKRTSDINESRLRKELVWGANGSASPQTITQTKLVVPFLYSASLYFKRGPFKWSRCETRIHTALRVILSDYCCIYGQPRRPVEGVARKLARTGHKRPASLFSTPGVERSSCETANRYFLAHLREYKDCD